MLIADLMVDLDAPVGIIAWLVRTIDIVIVICARNIRRREEIPSSLGDGTDFALLDEVVGECISDEASRAVGPCGGRIKNREGVIGEISISFLHGGNCHQAACRESAAQPEAGIGEKEMRLVLAIVPGKHHRPTNCEAEFVLPNRRLVRREVPSRIKLIVPHKLKRISVKFVRAGLQREVHHTVAQPIFRRI